jgi:predicted transcriptional regulator
MESRGEAILSCLFGVSLKYGKKYCYPSQGKIEQLLLNHHCFKISNRTLNRDLLNLVDEGYIERLRRTKRVSCGKREFTSTLYKFKAKAYIWLNSLGKWVKKVFSLFRLPRMADYKSKSGNEISKSAYGGVEMLWKSPIEGRASPTKPF